MTHRRPQDNQIKTNPQSTFPSHWSFKDYRNCRAQKDFLCILINIRLITYSDGSIIEIIPYRWSQLYYFVYISKLWSCDSTLKKKNANIFLKQSHFNLGNQKRSTSYIKTNYLNKLSAQRKQPNQKKKTK